MTMLKLQWTLSNSNSQEDSNSQNLFELWRVRIRGSRSFLNILATETGITGQSKGLGVGVQKDKYVRHISLHFSFLK